MEISQSLRSSLTLNGKCAIVTGAASGIGQAIAESLVDSGVRVVFAGRDKKRIDVAAQRATARGGEAIGVAVDVSQPDDIENCVEIAISKFGSIDVLFNSAGSHHNLPLLEITHASFDQLWKVNVIGLFFMLQACARHMIKQGRGGKIINVASIAGREGRAGQLEYNATKAAVINLTRSAALELIEHGIYVNAIAPGTVVTGMWRSIQKEVGEKLMHLDPDAFNRSVETLVPLKRLGAPSDMVGAALLLASSASDYIVGQTINIDGGMIMD